MAASAKSRHGEMALAWRRKWLAAAAAAGENNQGNQWRIINGVINISWQ